MRYLFVLLLLGGCATPEQRAADAAAQRAAYRVKVEDTCFAYGYKPNTPEWSNCMMQVDMAYQQQNAAMRQMLIQHQLNNPIRMPQIPVPQVPAPRQSVHCSPDYLGGMICR